MSNFNITKELLRFIDYVCIPKMSDLRHKILSKTHNSFYTTYPGDIKMYQDLKKTFWWIYMKIDVVDFVVRWLVCQQVKVEH